MTAKMAEIQCDIRRRKKEDKKRLMRPSNSVAVGTVQMMTFCRFPPDEAYVKCVGGLRVGLKLILPLHQLPGFLKLLFGTTHGWPQGGGSNTHSCCSEKAGFCFLENFFSALLETVYFLMQRDYFICENCDALELTSLAVLALPRTKPHLWNSPPQDSYRV